MRRSAAKRVIKIGLVGCGGRGSWISRLFRQHGGYEVYAVADYFQPVANACGEMLGIDRSRCFSGLSGYQRVIESGVEAIILKTPTCFFHEHAAAAVEAGLHVYMAKPIAVDVPTCLKFLNFGKRATDRKRVFLVDYQIPTDPSNRETAEVVRSGKLGQLGRIVTIGVGGGRPDPPKTATIESRLRNLVWDNDIAIGGGYIVSYDIHAIDGAIWVLGKRPVAAMGASRVVRPEPHGGDSPDVASVVYDYDDGLLHEHFGQALPNRTPGELSCTFHMHGAHARISYWGDAAYEIRGQKRVEKPVSELYEAGAKRNIAAFYNAICEEQYDNATVPRAVDGCLTCILGREAAAQRQRVTMDALLAAQTRIEVDLSGLKP